MHSIIICRSKSGSWQWDKEELHNSVKMKNESDRFPRSSSPTNSTANTIDITMPSPEVPKLSIIQYHSCFLYHHPCYPVLQVPDDAWAEYEPGKVGDCAVLDSSLRWSFNAIGNLSLLGLIVFRLLRIATVSKTRKKPN